MNPIQFTKMHGLGNDFIVINNLDNQFIMDKHQIQKISNRNLGIGFDQLLLIEQSKNKEIDFHYRIFNANGTEVEQCGNGARCFAKYIKYKKLSNKNTLKVSTMNNVISIDCNLTHDRFSVNMGSPSFEPKSIPLLAEKKSRYHIHLKKDISIECDILSIGNPHCVIITNDITTAPVETIGPQIEKHHLFPKGINVIYLEIINHYSAKIRVWERGVGETLACGSGACAAVISGIKNGFFLSDQDITIHLKYGDLIFNWNNNDQTIMMSGDANVVFEGTIER